MVSFRVAIATYGSMAAEPTMFPTAGKTKETRGRGSTSSFLVARAPASLGASAAPRKTDSTVDMSDKALSASPDIVLRGAERQGKKRSGTRREEVSKELESGGSFIGLPRSTYPLALRLLQ